MEILRQGTTQERPLQASKWLECQALIDAQEMTALFDCLGPFFLYACGVVSEVGCGEVSRENFLDCYAVYIDSLKRGVSPDPASYRPMFSTAMSVTTETFFAVPVSDNRQIIRVSKPLVQLQAHHMSYSTVDKKFHPMVFGLESISWGIQFSYPQLFRDDHTKQVEAVKDTPAFPNTHLFHALQKWVRQHTIPTPFQAEGVPVNVPMRLGKQCLSWINSHPHLAKKEIIVRC
ncbi:MAG: hypothetical protein WCF65_00850 [Parachlamydiaceae bacterium]